MCVALRCVCVCVALRCVCVCGAEMCVCVPVSVGCGVVWKRKNSNSNEEDVACFDVGPKKECRLKIGQPPLS